MTYLKNISRTAGNINLGGVIDLLVARKDEIESIPSPYAGVVSGQIVFKANSMGFVRWQVTQESVGIKSEDRTGREGSFKSNYIDFMIPRDRPDFRVMFDQSLEDEFIVVFRYSNSESKIFGSLQSPVRFSYSHDSGKSYAAGNFITGRFYYDGPDNIFFYDGTPTSVPGSTPPALVRINGEIIASLQPGDVIAIDTDFNFDFQIQPA